MKDEAYVKNYFRGTDTVATWWNPTEGDYAHVYNAEEAIISQWVMQNAVKNCLEASCGKGRVTRVLSPICVDYLATDISEQMLSIAKARAPQARFQQEDAENLSIESGSKDCVVCLEALVHYPNPAKAVHEFSRVLKKGGVLIVDSDNKYSLRRLMKQAFGGQNLGQDIFQPYSRSEFEGMLTDAGFQVEQFRYLGVASPIRVHGTHGLFYIISPRVSQNLQKLPIDKIPLLNRLATYHLVLARKSCE